MRTKRIVLLTGFASIVLLASCGGGSDDSGANVVSYGTCGNSPNYSNRVITRWRQLPVKVAIDVTLAPGVNNSNAGEYIQRIQQGASTWTGVTGLNSVVFVTPSEADVTIRFANLPDGPSGRGPHGRATYDTGSRYNQKGAFIELGILEFQRLLGTSFFLNVLSGVSMHEMGHLLFLRDHSPFPDDVMNELSLGLTPPTARDVNTMREAYCKAL